MKLDKAEAKKTLIQLIKYGVIGVLNTLITLVTFYVLNTLAGWDYVPANVVGYVLGVINSFLWNRNWVFKTKNNFMREAMLFVCGFFLCWMIQMGVSWFMLEGLDMKHMDEISWLPMKNTGQNIVMVIAMVFYTISNYIYNRTITFREKK